MTTLKMLILEGHHGVREALERRLGRLQGIQVVGVVGSVAEAEGLALEHRADVVLCDPRSVSSAPVDAIRRLRAIVPAVVVLTTSLIEGDATEFLAAGAASVLLKGCSMQAIHATILAAANERALVPTGAFARLGFPPMGNSSGGHAFAK